jgi:hypothetical protein
LDVHFRRHHGAVPRRDEDVVESQGLHYHSIEGQPYWDEGAHYTFRSSEIDELERATYALNDLCVKAVDHIFTSGRLAQFNVAPAYHDFLRHSWDHDELTVYGRFDFAFDGRSPPKLLEYNADTPTALLEAAVVQWFWLKETHPDADQFNSIHERLIDFIRMHVSQGGGLTPMRKVAAFAELYGVRTAWHGPGDVSPVGHAANVALDLACYNFGVQEYSAFSERTREVFSGCPTMKDGYLWANEAPGWGIEVDEKAAAKYPFGNETGERKTLNGGWGEIRKKDGTIIKQ